MDIESTNLKDCYVVSNTLHRDKRGYFTETFNSRDFNNLLGSNVNFVQDNQSKSSKGVLRGLHVQLGNSSQAKLVRVIQGSVLDVAVDLRFNSPTFGQHFSIELTENNQKQLFIPSGFAHGFVVLSDSATFFYKVDKFYSPGNESGIIYNDSDLKIDWGISRDKILVSEKDKSLGSFKDYCEQNRKYS